MTDRNLFRKPKLSSGKWWCLMFHQLSTLTTWSFREDMWAHSSERFYKNTHRVVLFPTWLSPCDPSPVSLTCGAVERKETAGISGLLMTCSLAPTLLLWCPWKTCTVYTGAMIVRQLSLVQKESEHSMDGGNRICKDTFYLLDMINERDEKRIRNWIS